MDKKDLRAHIRAFNQEEDPKKKAKLAKEHARENNGILPDTWGKSLERRFDRIVKQIEEENN